MQSFWMRIHLFPNKATQHVERKRSSSALKLLAFLFLDMLVTLEDLKRKKNGERRSFAEESGRVVLVLYMIR